MKHYLQNALDDLTGAMRVLVRTRPFLCGNPDEKKVGARKKKYYRRAQKRRRAAPDGNLSAAARHHFEAARLQDSEAADCVVADGERCAGVLCVLFYLPLHYIRAIFW